MPDDKHTPFISHCAVSQCDSVTHLVLGLLYASLPTLTACDSISEQNLAVAMARRRGRADTCRKNLT